MIVCRYALCLFAMWKNLCRISDYINFLEISIRFPVNFHKILYTFFYFYNSKIISKLLILRSFFVFFLHIDLFNFQFLFIFRESQEFKILKIFILLPTIKIMSCSKQYFWCYKKCCPTISIAIHIRCKKFNLWIRIIIDL